MMIPEPTRRAARAAAEQLARLQARRRPGGRVGKLTRAARLEAEQAREQLVATLRIIRRDLSLGVPDKDVIDYIDDELFKLGKS